MVFKSVALIMLIALCTAFSGQIVATAETYLSVDAETGDVYRVRERSRAYCDGTVVTRFRARRVASCAQSCDNSSFSGCDNSYNGCDNSSSCDRGPRRFRGVRVFEGFSGCDNSASSCDNSDSGSCASGYRSYRRW